jgi:hypothetical protein
MWHYIPENNTIHISLSFGHSDNMENKDTHPINCKVTLRTNINQRQENKLEGLRMKWEIQDIQ